MPQDHDFRSGRCRDLQQSHSMRAKKEANGMLAPPDYGLLNF
jgi:hypothetical protein